MTECRHGAKLPLVAPASRIAANSSTGAFGNALGFTPGRCPNPCGKVSAGLVTMPAPEAAGRLRPRCVVSSSCCGAAVLAACAFMTALLNDAVAVGSTAKHMTGKQCSLWRWAQQHGFTWEQWGLGGPPQFSNLQNHHKRPEQRPTVRRRPHPQCPSGLPWPPPKRVRCQRCAAPRAAAAGRPAPEGRHGLPVSAPWLPPPR